MRILKETLKCQYGDTWIVDPSRFKRLQHPNYSKQGATDPTLLPWTKARSLAVDLQIALADRISELSKTQGGQAL